MLDKTLESPLDCKDKQQSVSKERETKEFQLSNGEGMKTQDHQEADTRVIITLGRARDSC